GVNTIGSLSSVMAFPPFADISARPGRRHDRNYCLTGLVTEIIFQLVRSVEGRRREAFGWWDRMRRPRLRLASGDSGGHGAPVGRHQDRSARSSLDWDWLTQSRKRRPRPRKPGPWPKIAAMERRPARVLDRKRTLRRKAASK